MELPIPFPSDADVILEEVARFRALTAKAQVRELGESFRLYHFLRDTSGRADEIDRLAEEEERMGREAVKAFVARHG